MVYLINQKNNRDKTKIHFSLLTITLTSQVVLVVKNPPANAGDMRNLDLIPGLGRSPGGGRGNPLRYSCLEHPMDKRACWPTVLGGHKESDTTEAT